MKKTVLITGATSGIGEATARLFAENGFNLILTGRRLEKLENLSNSLSSKTKVHTLCFDVRNREDTFRLIETIPTDFLPINILINNAGNAHGLASFQDADMADWDAMLDINVKGLLNVSKAIIPGMINNGSGHIINIGSIAGRAIYPNGAVYCASKSAVDAITEGMRQDLNPHGIKVSVVSPGLVETEFSLVRFKGDEERAAGVYKGYQPLLPSDIADLLLFMVTRPAHVNLADTLILPLAQASVSMVKKDL